MASNRSSLPSLSPSMGNWRAFFLRASLCSAFEEAVRAVEEKRNHLRERTWRIEKEISNLPVELVEPEVTRLIKEASELDWEVTKLLASLRHPTPCFPCFCCCSYYPGRKIQAVLGRIEVLNAEPGWNAITTRQTPRSCATEMAAATMKEELSRLVALKKDLVSFVHEKLIMSGEQREIPTVVVSWWRRVNHLVKEAKVAGPREEELARIRDEIRALIAEENAFWRDGGLVVLTAPQVRKMEADELSARVLNDLRHLESVRMELRMLLKREVKESGRKKVMSNEVARWMRDVNSLVGDVGQVSNGDEMVASSSNCRAEAMAKILDRVVALKNRGLGFLSPDKSYLVTVDPPEILVAFEETISKVFAYLMDDRVGGIEIFGMEGAGKTTLAREIDSRLKLPQPPADFESVIFVDVKRNPNIFHIQRDIVIGLGYTGPYSSCSLPERANIISELLSQKKSLLIFDDLPKDDVDGDFDLGTAGVLSLAENPKSKVLLTTRASRQRTDRLKQLSIASLDGCNAWELFLRTNGTDEEYLERNEVIREIVEEILSKCHGLPLVIKAVARALAGKSDIEEWRAASLELNRYVAGLVLGKEKVFRLLQYCLENLERKEYISCLFFIALFPCDEEIDSGELINYWIAEGLLEFTGHYDLEKLQTSGHQIVEALRNACLLEKGSDDNKVKMHGIIHDMAIWLGKGGEDGNYEHKFIATESKEKPMFSLLVDSKWEYVERVYVDVIEKVVISDAISSTFRSLRTILFRKYLKVNIPEELFIFTPNLRVLDLSFNKQLRSIPDSLWFLKSLRYLGLSGTELERIPELIGSLKSLQFLYLSSTMIEEVPVEVGQLTNLLVLDLSGNRNVSSIPYLALSSMMNLHILELRDTESSSSDGGRIKDLNNLSQLSILSLSLRAHQDVKEIQECDVITRSISSLHLNDMENLTLTDVSLVLSGLSSLKEFHIGSCQKLNGTLQLPGRSLQKLEKLKLEKLPLSCLAVESQWQLHNLGFFMIEYCDQLTDLGCLLQFPNLVELSVNVCAAMAELIPPSKDAEVVAAMASSSLDQTTDRIIHLSLSKLEYIELYKLPELESISCAHLHLPLLRRMQVVYCPKLGKLPVIQSERVVQIECQGQWWEQLHWEDGCDTARDKFCFSKWIE